MKKIVLLAILLGVMNLAALAQKSFPQIEGITLDEHKVSLPLNNGKFSIIAIAYSRSAEDDLKKWLNPLYETFIKKEKNSGGLSAAEVYDVNFFFVPMISGFKKIADDFKKGTDKEYWPYILDTEKTDIKDVQKKVEAKDKEIPYFYVLNKEGKIVFETSGKYQEAKLSKLEEAVE